jgi:hypothetical protein
MRLEITPRSKESLIGFCDRMGLTQVAAVSHIVEWFSKQNDVIQAGIMDLYPTDIRADIPRLIMEEMARERK